GGDDVLVIAQGPAQPMVVRRKVRVLGLWLNGASARFWRVPGYYLLAGTRPLAEVLSEEERAAKRIGLEALPLEAAGNQQSEFREALMELKQAAGLWGEAGSMHIAGARLFRASLPLPATVPTGDYLVQVLLVREGRVVARQELGFRVGRVGTAARIANVAKVQPVVYGLLCILLAALAGWLGSVLFRRG
ncbi:TIGR02186 family protein, partial [Teichococcus aestuarii]